MHSLNPLAQIEVLLCLGRDQKGLGFESITRGTRNDLTRTEPVLTDTAGERRTIVVDVTHEVAAAMALDLGSFALDSPVIKGFEEGHDLVLLLESEFVGVDGGEGDGCFVPGFEVEIGREQVVRV